MKFGISQNGKKFRSIVAIAIAFSILSNSATAQDLYFKDVNSQSGKLDLSASSNWFTDASKTEQFVGNLSTSNNGIVDCDGTSATAYIGSDLTLGNLEWKISGIDTSADLSSIAESATMNISGNLNMPARVSGKRRIVHLHANGKEFRDKRRRKCSNRLHKKRELAVI